MPDRPDYPALTRGQIAVTDRVNAGESGLPVLQQLVRLAQDVLGARGAGFAEYADGHGRIIAATGVCEPAIGRRVKRADDRLRRGDRTLLVPLDSVNDEFARQIEGGDLRHMLGARCEAGDTFAGRCTSTSTTTRGARPRAPRRTGVARRPVGRLYGRPAGLPVHGGRRPPTRPAGRPTGTSGSR